MNIVVCFLSTIFVAVASENNNVVSLPLRDNLKAVLTANLDVKNLNIELSDFIQKEVYRQIQEILNGTSFEMVYRKIEDGRNRTLDEKDPDPYISIKDQCLRKNLALNKPCGQSSLYRGDPSYACNKANDGNFSEFMHTQEVGMHGLQTVGESFPSWWVDLETSRSVKEVVIHNRQNTYFYRLQNVHVTVGDDLSTLHHCGYHSGPPENMKPLIITCSEPVMGRYVQIIIMKRSSVDNFLLVTEVEVYGCWP